MNYLKYLIGVLFIVQSLSIPTTTTLNQNLTVIPNLTLSNFNKSNESIPIVITRITSRPLMSSSALRKSFFLDNFISYSPL